MHSRLQTKLYIGFSFLFLVIVVIWVMSSVYIFKLSSDSDKMLKDNYKSIVSAKFLSGSLDEMKDMQSEFFFRQPFHFDDSAYYSKIRTFEKNLDDEENNITEKGEKELVVNLTVAFNEYVGHFSKIRNDSLKDNKSFYFDLLQDYHEAKQNITAISDLNMDAIIKKNGMLTQTSNKAFFYISIIGTVFFLISFSILMNFPRNIVEPVRELMRGIEEIARRNYDQQLFIDSNDEFGDLAKSFNTMVRKLNEFEKSNLAQILHEKKRIEAIISNIRDAIIGLDESKVIIFANPVACEILGMEPSGLVGKNLAEVAMKNDLFRNLFGELTGGTYRTGETAPIKIVMEGKESYFIKDILDVRTPAPGDGGMELIGHLVILKNITRFREIDDAKTNFIATVSHEIKSPIASARLNLKLLGDERIGTLNDEQRILVTNAREEVNRLQKITGELLDLTQVETGTIHMQIQQHNPRMITDYAVDAVRSSAKQKNIGIIEDVPDNLPQVNADIEKTAWVLINLLNNAIQYSDEGGKIIVSARVEEKEIHFSVRDFGKGIEEKYLDQIFERFFRIPGSPSSGTGLGLTISKEFITRQKGRIWTESKPGEGSTFNFTIPLG
jgi:signal transduction histidine kinase